MSQRAGSTVVEVAGSHSIYVSQPAAVAALIKQAASAVAARQWPGGMHGQTPRPRLAAVRVPAAVRAPQASRSR